MTVKRRAAMAAPAEVLLLGEHEAEEFRAELDRAGEFPYLLSKSVLMGCLGMHRDVLARATRITQVFQRACRAIHTAMPGDATLRRALLRPLTPLPSVWRRVLDLPFFLEYLRMDFFPDASGNLWIIEVNSGGAGLTDYLRCMRWLRDRYDFSPPEGCRALAPEDMLRCITDHALALRPGMTVLGFVPVENGNSDQLPENLEYARWLWEHTDLTPAFFALTRGMLAPYDHPAVPAMTLSRVDAMLVDWFEDLPCLERVEGQLRAHDILSVPPRSDLLFENKHFLSLLQRIERPQAISEDDWQLLQSALPSSFPLEELDLHIEEIRAWPGLVLKMDIDCASENVFLYDFEKVSAESTVQALQRTCQAQKNTGPTWTVQQFVPPPTLPLGGKRTPPWIGFPYEPYRYDLMTYLCLRDGKPHVLFGSRQFSTEKVDDLTVEGREDNIFSAVCRL